MIVKLLHFPIPDDEATYRAARALLSAEDQSRSDRFGSRPARQRHAVGRAMVRLVGAAAFGMEAQAVPLAEHSGGKPYCPLPGAACFNLSHTGHGDDDSHGLLAVADAEVGVDLEIEREVAHLVGMAAIVLGESERAMLFGLPAEQQSGFFLRLWTRKEAVLKAAGVGLRSDPRAIDVAGAGHALLGNHEVRSPDGAAWFVRDIALQDGLLAAVASACPFEVAVKMLSLEEVRLLVSEVRKQALLF